MIVMDIEANGFLREATTIWCCAWINSEAPGNIFTLQKFIGRMQDEMEFTDKIIGHNIIGYDLPLLKKLCGWEPPKFVEIIDTLVWSRLFYPDLQVPEGWKGKPKPHSLEAWAMRLEGEQKVEQEQWDEFDPNMVTRCISDVKINEQLYYKLLKEYEK